MDDSPILLNLTGWWYEDNFQKKNKIFVKHFNSFKQKIEGFLIYHMVDDWNRG